MKLANLSQFSTGKILWVYQLPTIPRYYIKLYGPNLSITQVIMDPRGDLRIMRSGQPTEELLRDPGRRHSVVGRYWSSLYSNLQIFETREEAVSFYLNEMESLKITHEGKVSSLINKLENLLIPSNL